MNNRNWLIVCMSVCVFVGAARAQSPKTLTLKEAEAIAVKNHPRLRAAFLTMLAANQVTTETRSAYYPNVFASLTGAGALFNSRIAAGALNNPIIYERLATGFTVSQMVTDFGRTSNLGKGR
jgi:outer membrane protein